MSAALWEKKHAAWIHDSINKTHHLDYSFIIFGDDLMISAVTIASYVLKMKKKDTNKFGFKKIESNFLHYLISCILNFNTKTTLVRWNRNKT